MSRKLELILKVQKRKDELGLTIDNLAQLSSVSSRTINRFFSEENISIDVLDKVTECLGVDYVGNEFISKDELIKKRAREKALYIVSLVQGTSALEIQGLENDSINKLISKAEKEFLYGDYKDKLWVL